MMYAFICDECNKEMNSMCSNVYGTKRICDKCLELKLRKEIEGEKEIQDKFVCDKCKEEFQFTWLVWDGEKKTCYECSDIGKAEQEEEDTKFVCDGCGWIYEIDQCNEYEYGLKSLCNGCYETQIEEDRQNGEY